MVTQRGENERYCDGAILYIYFLQKSAEIAYPIYVYIQSVGMFEKLYSGGVLRQLKGEA